MKKLIALLLLIPVPCWAIFTSYDTIRNQDGTHDTGFPNGTKPPPPTDLLWNLSTLDSAVGLNTGSAYSDDISDCCLSGADESAATVTIETCSGDDAATNGWAVSGSHPDKLLANAGSDGDLPGSGAFGLRATVGADSALSNCINWSYVAAPAGDTLDPPIPTGLEVTGTATNQVSLRFDGSCDNYTGSEAGSGSASYNIKLGGANVDTVVSPGCVTPQLTQIILGASDGPGGTQTGNQWEMTFGGSGIGGTADNALLRNTAISGDVVAIAKVTSLTSAASFAKAGVYVRADTTAGAAGYYLFYQINGNVQMRGRATAGVATTVSCNQTVGALPLWVALVESQGTGTLTGYYSADGGEWTTCATVSIAMPTTVQTGLFVASTTASTTMTADLDEFNVSALPKVTKNVSTLSGGTWTVTALDNEANESAASDGVFANPAAPSAPVPIYGATFDMATVVNVTPGNSKAATNSDNWPITWADNGHQYTSWGDGSGFGGTTPSVSFGVGRIEGAISTFSAFNVHGGFQAENTNTLPNGKSYGILSVDGVLYMWRNGDGSNVNGYNIESLYKSTDHGASWAIAGSPNVTWLKTDSPPKGFTHLSFIQYGQDYTGIPAHAQNGGVPYVYSVGFNEKQGDWEVQEPGEIILVRVPKDEIEIKASYEWFAGFSGSTPTWTSTYNNRIPVISSSDGFMIASAAYNPILLQYILIGQQHSRLLASDAFIGMWSAEEPWGPWTRFLYEDAADGSWLTNAGGANPTALAETGTHTVAWFISQKWSWSNVDGTDIVLVGTFPDDDEFGKVEGTLDLTPPPAGSGHRWNPGHYLKVNQDPCQQDQTAYWNNAFNLMNNEMLDDPLIIGAHIGVCWGAINPTGTTHNVVNMRAALDNANATGRKVVFQIQPKTFGSFPDCNPAPCDGPGFLVPADLGVSEVAPTSTGSIASLHRAGNMDRLIDTFEFVFAEFADHPAFEGLMINESAPSYGTVGSPSGYSNAALATQIKRLYAAAAVADGQANFFCNINSLGTEVAGLQEECYQLGLSSGGPDARATPGYDQFAGASPAVRDYRTLMGGLWAASNSVLCVIGPGTCAAKTPAEVINDEQVHDSTHISWITFQQETGRTWTDIKAAINADPILYLTCPANYIEGCQ